MTDDEGILASRALSRWDNEGGACLVMPSHAAATGPSEDSLPEMTNTELVHLRVGVIALENLVISLVAGATDRQIDLAREMAGFIAPRPGSTQHPLTIQAASQMDSLVSTQRKTAQAIRSKIGYEFEYGRRDQTLDSEA